MNLIMRRVGGLIIVLVIIASAVPLMAKGTKNKALKNNNVSADKPAEKKQSDFSWIKVTSVDVAFANFYTMGKYRDFSDMNFGPAVQVNLQIAGIKLLRVYGAFISSYNMTNSNRLDVLNDFTGHIGAGLNLRLFEHFSINPQAGYGMIVHLGYGDYHLLGEKKYHVFTDQIFCFEVETAFHFKVGTGNFPMKIFLSPAYMVFIEEEHAGQEIGYRFGVGFEF